MTWHRFPQYYSSVPSLLKCLYYVITIECFIQLSNIYILRSLSHNVYPMKTKQTLSHLPRIMCYISVRYVCIKCKIATFDDV